MSYSETDLCNAALRLIAGNRITSLTDGSKAANVLNDIYDMVRDDLLRGHLWNFATRRAQLARSSTAPTFEYDYAYVLPSDWMRTISVHDNDGGTGTVDYREAEVNGQGVIEASVETVYLLYVAKITDPNRMPADFRTALITALARDCAVPLANSNTLFVNLSQKADRDLLRAKFSDGAGSRPERRPRGSWATSRGGWRTSTDSFRT